MQQFHPLGLNDVPPCHDGLPIKSKWWSSFLVYMYSTFYMKQWLARNTCILQCIKLFLITTPVVYSKNAQSWCVHIWFICRCYSDCYYFNMSANQSYKNMQWLELHMYWTTAVLVPFSYLIITQSKICQIKLTRTRTGMWAGTFGSSLSTYLNVLNKQAQT